MKLVFDFDHTLFDMMAMHTAIESEMESIGVTPVQYREAYTKVTNWKKFTVSALAQMLAKTHKIKPEEVVAALDRAAAQSKQWLFPDVIDGLQRLKADGHQLFLLSWGDTDWQMKKIEPCGIMPLFEKTLSIAEVKADYMKQWQALDGGKAVLIDDKPAELKAVEAAGNDIGCIRMRRDGAKYSDQETPQGMAEAQDMNDVISIIKQWSGRG